MKVRLNGNDFYEVSSPFGDISNIHPNGHTGLDLVMETGTILHSPVDGVVKKVVDFGSENIGKGVYIETDDHQTVIMGHLSDFKVHEGQSIHEGDIVALSGNTGHSTGSHLHLGLKDADGSFTNPEPLLTSSGEGQISWSNFLDNGKVGRYQTNVSDKGILEFLNDWRHEGFWMAMYDKPFSQVLGDFFKELGHDILLFFLSNGDLFFLLPAVGIFLGTWLIGRNKLTKWIVPLLMAYSTSRVFYHLI